MDSLEVKDIKLEFSEVEVKEEIDTYSLPQSELSNPEVKFEYINIQSEHSEQFHSEENIFDATTSPDYKQNIKYFIVDCNAPTLNASSFKNENKISTSVIKEKHFRYQDCEFKTSRGSTIKSHMIRRKGEKPFQCNLCGYAAAFQHYVQRHMKIHSAKKLQCEECEYTTADKSNLNKHMKKHSGEESYKCEMCEYATSNKTHFNEHMRKHSGEKPHACRQCTFKTARKDCLTKHMMIHTGEKPFACYLCDYATARKEHLPRHIETHTVKKLFEAPLPLQRKTNLTDMLFQCKECLYRTPHNDYFKNHMKCHTGERPLHCPKCSFKTKTTAPLTFHIKMHH